MQLTLTPGEGESILSVSGELTLLNAAEFRTEMLRALDSSLRVVIDTCELTDIDLAGLQLILAAHQSALAKGKELFLDQTSSEVLTRQIERAGLTESFFCGKGGPPSCLGNGGDH